MDNLKRRSDLCLEAWMNCEDLLAKISETDYFSHRLKKVIDECAHICLGTFHAIKTHSIHTAQLALLCLGICEECAEACDEYDDVHFQLCAQACRNCSRSIKEIAGAAV